MVAVLLKYCLFVLNFIFWCLVGAITFVVAFIGCLGALRENICLLKTSQLSMLGVLVLEALIGATVFAFYAMPEVRRHIKAGPEEVLKMAIRRYHDDEELQRWVDLIQREPSELFDRIYTQGCMKGLGKWLSSHDVAIGSASIAIIIPQIICVIFARLLIQHIQRQRVRWRVLHSSK
nr:hypothetical protein BaRGS_013394 [Batillaria attramentaria]